MDLDLFVTAIESKLRGPFSSLDLTKTVTTPALRGDVSESQYLRQISQVLSKPDKISQMRILIGLLGLDPEPELDQVVYSIIRKAQGKEEQEMDGELTHEERLAHRYEEWVQVIAGLVQGIMFKEDDESQSYGEEAKSLLDSSCDEIIQKVEKVTAQTLRLSKKESKEQEDESSSSTTAVRKSLMNADFDPLMAPYRYSLLNPNLLEEVIPDALGPNPHFTVNDDAAILAMDTKLEFARAREESEHAIQFKNSQRNVSGSSDRSSGSAATPMAYMPGMNRKRPASSSSTDPTATKKKAVERPKTSMFLTAKKPMGTGGGPNAAKRSTGLHVRKTGAAQRLVGKGRQLQTTSTTGAGGAAAGTGGGTGAGRAMASRLGGGRALKAMGGGGAAGARSKMKMIDDSEASNLAKHQQDHNSNAKLIGSKRRAGAASMRSTVKSSRLDTTKTAAMMTEKTALDNSTKEQQQPQQSPPTETKEEEEDEEPARGMLTEGNASPTALAAAAALSKYQAQQEANAAASAGNNDDGDGDYLNNNNNSTNALAAAALSKYQSKVAAASAAMGTPTTAAAVPADAAAAVEPPTARQLNWQKLLSSKSNRLTDTDRERIQMFFKDRVNPTPAQSVYKMKLHEDRTTDVTGKPVKETYYLELNYDNFTSKQSKKVKRYDK